MMTLKIKNSFSRNSSISITTNIHLSFLALQHSAKFPLHLLKCAEKTYILCELKSGESYNGTLESMDKFMNLKLLDVVQTSKEGDSFHKIPEIFIRGNSIKYIRMVDTVLEKAVAEPMRTAKKTQFYNKREGNQQRRGRNERSNRGGGHKRGARGG